MLVYWIYPKEEVLFNRKIRGDEWLSYNPFHLTCKWERRPVISLLAFMFTLVFPSLLFFSVPHIVQPHAQVFVHAWGFLRSSSSKKVRCLSNSSYCRHLQENSTGSTNLIYPNLKVTLGWVLFDLHTNTHTTSSIHPFLVARVSLGDLQTWSAAMSFAEWGNQKKLGVAILKQTSWDTSDTQISVSGCHVEAWKIAFGAFSSAKKTEVGRQSLPYFCFSALQWYAFLIMECGALKQFETQSVQNLGISLKDQGFLVHSNWTMVWLPNVDCKCKENHAVGLHRSIAPVCVNKNEETRSRRWSVCPFGPKTGSKASEPWEGAMPPKLLRKKIWGHRHRNSSVMIYYTTTSELRLSWIMDYGHESTNANKKTYKDHGFCLILQNIFFFRWSLYFHLSKITVLGMSVRTYFDLLSQCRDFNLFDTSHTIRMMYVKS